MFNCERKYKCKKEWGIAVGVLEKLYKQNFLADEDFDQAIYTMLQFAKTYN